MKKIIDCIKKHIEKIIFAGLFLLGVLTIQEGHNWGGDFSQYIAQAYALINEDVMGWLEKSTYIIENSPLGLSSTIYPWGYPMLLVPVLKIFGTNFIAIKLEILICFLISIFVIKKIFESKMDKKLAIIGYTSIGFSIAYINVLDSALSDIPCMMFSLISVLFVEKRYKEKEKNLLWNILTGISIFLAYFMRTQALVLLLALLATDASVLVYNLILKDKIKIPLKSTICLNKYFFIIPYLIFAALILICNMFLPSAGETYGLLFNFNLISIYRQAIYYGEQYMILLGVFTIFISTVVLGVFSNFFDELYSVFYVLGMTALVCMFNGHQGPRYVFGVYPLVVMFMCYGAEYVITNIHGITKKLYSFIYLCLAVAIVSDIAYVLYRRNTSNAAYSEEAVETYRWIDDNIDDTKVIAFFKPRVLYLETGNYTYQPNKIKTLKDADYALIDIKKTDYYPDYEEILKGCELVYYNSEFMLYKIK